jgi:hypothetical protein
MKLISGLLVVVLLLGFGCKGSDGDTGPAGTSGDANFTSYLYGSVSNRDEYGNNKDTRGTTIAIGGTTLTQTVDSTRRFFIGGIRAGVYPITISRPGFGTLRPSRTIYGEINEFFSLDSLPSYTVSNLRGGIVGSGSGATRNDTIAYSNAVPAGRNRRVVFFYGRTPNVSSDPAQNVFAQFPNQSAAGATQAVNSVPRSTFINSGFASGQTVYVAAYGISLGFSSYQDPVTFRTVYPALTPISNVVSFQLP